MAFSSSLGVFTDALDKLSPEYRKEKQWKAAAREMEVAKFASQMKANKLANEKAELQLQMDREKGSALERYEALKSVREQVSELLATPDFASLPEADKEAVILGHQKNIQDPAARELFQEVLVSGDIDSLERAIDMTEGSLESRYGVDIDDVSKKMYFSKDGKVRYLREDSPLIDRPAAEWEVQAHREGLVPGSNEWKARADPEWAEQNDLVEVLNPEDRSKGMYVPRSEQNKYEPISNREKSEDLDIRSLVDADGNHVGNIDMNDPDPATLRRVLNGELFPSNSPPKTDSDKRPTEAESKAALFGTRVKDSNVTIAKYEDEFSDSLARGGVLPEFAKGGNRKEYEQAGRNFINAILRRESGAVIADSEFENAYLQYLPRPGDNQATLDLKRRNRLVVQKGLEVQGGEAFKDLQRELEKEMGVFFFDMGDGTTQGYAPGTIIENSQGEKARVTKNGKLVRI